MKLSVNEAKLTGLWARNCGTIHLRLMSKFAFVPEKLPQAFGETGVWAARGGGDSAYERGGDARRKFWIKTLKETDLGVAQAFFDL